MEADALAALGLTGHPKADALWRLAWEHGHSHGAESVLMFAEDFADLLTPVQP